MGDCWEDNKAFYLALNAKNFDVAVRALTPKQQSLLTI